MASLVEAATVWNYANTLIAEPVLGILTGIICSEGDLPDPSTTGIEGMQDFFLEKVFTKALVAFARCLKSMFEAEST